jgi:hypothetical protein
LHRVRGPPALSRHRERWPMGVSLAGHDFSVLSLWGGPDGVRFWF